MNDPFDFVIVGAGSAGSVLANRLSENGQHSVCLLEAGGSARHPSVRVPAGWATTIKDPVFDWCYSTEPEPELNHRVVDWPRGLGLGGSSLINGMIYIRGHAVDFDRWVQAGAEGWSYEDVLPYFRRAERQQRICDEYHSSDGPLHVQDPRDQRSVHRAFIEGMVESGLPRNADFNGADQTGAGFYQFTQHNGRRWSVADAYLRSAKSRKNLSIEIHALAHKILFEGKRATGVRVLHRGKVRDFAARHIVLCCGAINTPQLLELSGVGDREHLEPLGVSMVHHAPDVGEHLQDHPIAKVVYGAIPTSSMNREVQGWRLGVAVVDWFFRRRGPLTTGSAPVGGFAATREGLDAPDVQFFFASGSTLYNAKGKIKAEPIPAASAAVNQSRPESRGSVHIKSNLPEEHPQFLPTICRPKSTETQWFAVSE